MLRYPAGTTVTVRGKIVSGASGAAYFVETDHGNVRIPESMIVAADHQNIEKDSIVESILPSRTGVRGVVIAIDGCDAWVKWSNNVNKTEKLLTLRIYNVPPN